MGACSQISTPVSAMAKKPQRTAITVRPCRVIPSSLCNAVRGSSAPQRMAEATQIVTIANRLIFKMFTP